ncbi:hypothetical protein [Mangrovibacterium marinum]|uniref:Outer membrane protein with beta-barrel domain n=1 Tax=Mangrovibacterium marinum TaxID=1639118 RepID=A0A2T5C2H7_9BACT|nr:hypothetical protein [Mangrovibacterium marinum]PTN08934.1 hypothetical protein C8N47_10631 [Mangrovibacterium marinum]
MKKRFLTMALLLISAAVFAQSAPLAQGEKQLNFGLGESNHGLPLYIGADFAFHNDWTAGPVLKLILDDDDSKFAAIGRVDYHWNRLMEIPSNWDFYLGANLGVLSGDGVDLNLGLQIGGRYYWSDRWGVNLEIGGGTGFDTAVGLSMKF